MSAIIYPQPLVRGRTIGVTAPSSSVEPGAEPRLDLVIRQLREDGYPVREGASLRSAHEQLGAPAAARAADLVALWRDPDVGAIIPPWGGEMLVEILPLLDGDALAATEPKWLLGYSDISTLLFALTVRTGIATAHGPGLVNLLRHQAYGVTQATLGALAQPAGSTFVQTSFPKHQVHGFRYEHDVARAFNATEQTRWRTLSGSGARGDAPVAMAGRLIGGCLDTLLALVGTRFGELPAFTRRFAPEGVIFYFENCELSPTAVARGLWSLREAGWFAGVTGFLVGRSAAHEANAQGGLTFASAVERVLGPLGLPIILDADLGHRPPQLVLINGALAEVECRDGRGTVRQTLG